MPSVEPSAGLVTRECALKSDLIGRALFGTTRGATNSGKGKSGGGFAFHTPFKTQEMHAERHSDHHVGFHKKVISICKTKSTHVFSWKSTLASSLVKDEFLPALQKASSEATHDFPWLYLSSTIGFITATDLVYTALYPAMPEIAHQMWKGVLGY